MSNRVVVAAGLVALLVAACTKKDEAGADAAADATPAAVAPVVEADAATPTAAKPVVKPAPVVAKSDAGVADAGLVADAGPSADAGVDTCCCDVPGQTPSQVGQSECVKTRKGTCVKKDKCASAAPAADAGAAAQQCCCDSGGGKKAMKGQSECTKGGAGKCVAAKECK